jgi:hypothetical protein
MDYLGQGDSWPVDCDDGNAPSELGLRYSADDWIAQTIDFIEAMVRALTWFRISVTGPFVSKAWLTK